MSVVNQIKAIPTEYGGYEFRSRLEAKWAAFFDRHNCQWEYEPKMFTTIHEFRDYIPDFWVSEGIDYWVEIKPASAFWRAVLAKPGLSGARRLNHFAKYHLQTRRFLGDCDTSESFVLIVGDPSRYVMRGLDGDLVWVSCPICFSFEARPVTRPRCQCKNRAA